MAGFKVALQCVEVIGPVAPVPVDPFVDLDQSVGAQRVYPALGIRSHLDQSDFAEHPQVAGHRRLSQPGQRGDEFARRSLTSGERVEQGAPAGFGDRLEHIHATSIAPCLYRRKAI